MHLSGNAITDSYVCVSYTCMCFIIMCILCVHHIYQPHVVFVNEHFLVPGTVAHTCNPRTLEAEAGGLS